MFWAECIWPGPWCTCGLKYGTADLSRSWATLPGLWLLCQLVPSPSGSEEDRSNPAWLPETLWLNDGGWPVPTKEGRATRSDGGISGGGPIAGWGGTGTSTDVEPVFPEPLRSFKRSDWSYRRIPFISCSVYGTETLCVNTMNAYFVPVRLSSTSMTFSSGPAYTTQQQRQAFILP